MQRISPYLWFNTQAAEAADFYVGIFKNSKILNSNPMITTFSVDGLVIMALNGGPQFKFSEAVSFFISCKDQAEVDEYWDKLIANGGSEGRCGWLKDKFGLSWQVVPQQLGELLGGSDRSKSSRVQQAMLKMNKLIVADLQAA